MEYAIAKPISTLTLYVFIILLSSSVSLYIDKTPPNAILVASARITSQWI